MSLKLRGGVLPELIEIRLSDLEDRLLAYGGSPAGRDGVHRIIRSWPGWKRLKAVGRSDGAPCSIYSGPVSPISALHICQTSLNMRIQPPALARLQKERERLDRAEKVLSGELPGCFASGGPTDRVPMEHQARAVAALSVMGWRAILGDDMGLGKTSTALWALQHCPEILVVCPASVKFNWQDEVQATLGRVCIVIDGTRRDRANMFTFLAGYLKAKESPDSMGHMVVVINYDLLRHLTEPQKNLLADFARGQGLICDESHYLKGNTSERTKLTRDLFATKHISSGAKYRLLLSGTPIRNTVEDVYSQIELVYPGTWTSKTDFSNRHLVVVPKTVQVKGKKKTYVTVEGARDLPGLNLVLRSMMVRRVKEEVLNLPPKLHTSPKLTFQDDAAMRRIYNVMRDFAVLQLNELSEDMSIFQPQARGAVQAAMRCEQIAQGFCGGIPETIAANLGPTLNKNAEKIPGRPKELLFPRHPKIVWLTEALKTLLLTNHRVVVYSRFLAPLYWMQSCGLARFFIHGGMDASEKKLEIDTFRFGDPSVLACQVTIAEGFNLTECQDVIFLGRDWSPAVNRQAEDRCHRIGTRGTVNVQIPIVLGTMETMIDRRLKAKEADASGALKTVTVAELRDSL